MRGDRYEFLRFPDLTDGIIGEATKWFFSSPVNIENAEKLAYAFRLLKVGSPSGQVSFSFWAGERQGNSTIWSKFVMPTGTLSQLTWPVITVNSSDIYPLDTCDGNPTDEENSVITAETGGWDENAYSGMLLGFTSGNAKGKIYTILSNTTNTLTVDGNAYADGARSGDSFSGCFSFHSMALDFTGQLFKVAVSSSSYSEGNYFILDTFCLIIRGRTPKQ